jgi:hypothetical protein
VKRIVPSRFRPAVRALEPKADGPSLAALMTRAQWSVDHVDLAGTSVEIHGWAIPAPATPADRTFLVNGRPFDSIDYPRPRDDIARLFSYLPDAGACGFLCRATAAADDLFGNGFAEFEFAVAGDSRSLDCSSYYPDPRLDTVPLPEADRRVRVHGSRSESSFRIEGASTFVRLRQALGSRLGADFADFNSLLDWGCGCGRSSRYLVRAVPGRICGVDIDRDNIEWCAAHLTSGRFEPIPLHPPTRLGPDTFDLLIGISVFTHLGESEQFEWLGELRRIAAPGAILLMTVHGDAAVCRAGLARPHFDEWMRRGFLDAGLNPGLQGAIPEADYYRNTFQRMEYVRDRWAQYFEILDILPGHIGTFQDLVIMRKR